MKNVLLQGAYGILVRMKGGFKARYQLPQRMAKRLHRTDGAHLESASRGFTIVEVMIVLAVTGALFVSAAIMISGRQNRTQFQQAINNIRTQIQQTINDVNSGFYPNMNDFDCFRNGAGISFASGGSQQGTNKDCVFLGKVLQFGVQGTDPQQFVAYSIAGLRQNTDGTETTTYSQADARVATLDASSPDKAPSDTETLQYGLTVHSMRYVNAGDGTNRNIGAVGFLSTLASYDAGLVSGAQQVNLVPVNNSALQVSPATAVTQINSNLKNSPVSPTGDIRVEICFASGGTDQSGLVTIGGSGRQLSVTLSIKGGKTC